jgi:hypothetical protein
MPLWGVERKKVCPRGNSAGSRHSQEDGVNFILMVVRSRVKDREQLLSPQRLAGEAAGRAALASTRLERRRVLEKGSWGCGDRESRYG